MKALSKEQIIEALNHDLIAELSAVEMYGAHARRYHGQRRAAERVTTHPDIVFEPGKCILCGLCVQIAEQLREPLGLAQVGRGFDVRVAVPFDASLAEALKAAAGRCVEACPTSALAWKRDSSTDERGDTCPNGSCQGCPGDLEPKQ